MPTPQVGLAALSIVTPVIPPSAETLSVDTSVLKFVIDADTNTLCVNVTIGSSTKALTGFTVFNGKNRFSGSVPVPFSTNPQVLEISGQNFLPSVQNPTNALHTATIQLQILTAAPESTLLIGPPSGITIYKGQSTCRVEWAIPTYLGFQGVQVQWSTDPSGVNTPYVQFGDLQTNVTRRADVTVLAPVSQTASKQTVADPPTYQVTTTTSSMTQTVVYGSVDIPFTTVSADVFYVLLSTVVQDANTNMVYQSQAAGPFTCGFVNLKKVNPTDFLALQKAPDIAGRMIAEVTRRRPDLDLTAHSELRDTIINPLSLELASMSVREWFSRCATSISALSQLDDADGDGISDPVAASPVKQQLARAYGLSTTAIQSFIDTRFRVLGEMAGVSIGGATQAVVELTFYTYSLPIATISIPQGIVCSTNPSITTTGISFVTTASAIIDPRSAASYYDSANGWWAVTVPAQAQTAGADGNVGAETIRQITTSAPSGISVTNLKPARNGSDRQSNADYAAMIQNRQVAGKDSGTRNGYWETARKISGITSALVVAAGDVDMLRDWSTVIQKHTFGCVDIYVQGSGISQAGESLPFALQSSSKYGIHSTYLNAKLISASALSFRVQGFTTLSSPIYALVEMLVTASGRTLWLGCQNAQFDNANGIVYLSPNENVYTVNDDGSTSIWQLNGVNATNVVFLNAIATMNATYQLMARYQSGIAYTPLMQPVTAINSVTGPITGTLPLDAVEVVYTSDFLLAGGSTAAGDYISVASSTTQAVTKTLDLNATTVFIDSDISLDVDANGNPTNILSVRSNDLSTLYEFGVDYTIVPAGPYRSYALKVLNDDMTGQPRITLSNDVNPDARVIVGYNQFLLREAATLQTETITLNGSSPTALSNPGFIRNSWMPASHGDTTLLLDGYAPTRDEFTGLMGAGVPPAQRYIKVAYSNGQSIFVLIEGKDFVLTVDSSGRASLTRVPGGGIPDGANVEVSYFTNEVFFIHYNYPGFVQQLASQLETTKHAAAGVLVKAMVPNAIDIVMNVVLESNVTADTMDGRIRTAIGRVIDSANKTFAQSVLIRQVQALTGVKNVQLPLLKCAKADGSYDIGSIVPTGTSWVQLKTDVNFNVLPSVNSTMWITQSPVLPNPTIPSGGTPNSYVGMLYEGQSFRRALSIQDFLSGATPSFYIIGANDQITDSLLLDSTYSGRILFASPFANPALQAYRVTYQIYGAASASDIRVASCEYLQPGTITINYLSGV